MDNLAEIYNLDGYDTLDELLDSLEFLRELDNAHQEWQPVTPNNGNNALADTGRYPEHMYQ